MKRSGSLLPFSLAALIVCSPAGPAEWVADAGNSHQARAAEITAGESGAGVDTAQSDTASSDTAPGDTASSDTAPGDTAPGDFDRHIRPILRSRCVECHSKDDASGGLRLDHASFSEPTDSGRATVVPRSPSTSGLFIRVTSADEDERMPPEGDPLSKEQIEQLRRWIATMPPDSIHVAPRDTPDSIPVKVESDHWAFQPVDSTQPPAVQDPHWARGTLDRFIQARREQAGLAPTDDADPVTLIRRISFDLTGLPPTSQDATRFYDQVARHGMPHATERMVDDLLSRPAYGERWGRHWMDWVRYADTAGDNSDYPIPQAWLYRKYIIDAFNDDLPYDRFLTEQIAGDLLPHESQQQHNRQTVATGYLAMARRFGSLVERYPWHLTIEDTIDNLGRTMMGMTLACARCHDHKFDPVSTRDYYALYGIFESTRYPFPGIELFQSQRDFVSLLDRKATDDLLDGKQATTDKLIADLDHHLNLCRLKAVENTEREKDCSIKQRRQMRDQLDGMLIKARKAGEALAAHLKSLPELPTAYAVSDASPVDASIQIKGEPNRPGAIVRRGFPGVLGGWRLTSSGAEQSSGRLQLADWITDPNNPLTARVIVNRVWQRHFGRGLVPSTSDFGLRGERPSHPLLLDYLAKQFIDQGWSLKQLHRTILTSRTYALASSGRRENVATDPDNRMLWRFNRQRLDAESLRDTLLMLAGNLDATPQSQPYPFPKRKDWAFTQHHPFKGDYPNARRSVYQMTKRLTAQSYLQTFDGPDPNVCTSRRDQSVTALQALYFVNDEFLHKQSSRLAETLLQSSGDDHDRIEQAFLLILSRKPSQHEREMLSDHLAAVRSRLGDDKASGREAWASLTRSLFRLNEFLYLD